MLTLISSSGRDWYFVGDRPSISRLVVGTRGCVITNDWRMSMARSFVGNRATSVSDRRPIVRSITVPTDWSYDQSGCQAIDRTITIVILRPIVRIVMGHDQLHDRSFDCVIRGHPQTVMRPSTTGGTIT